MPTPNDPVYAADDLYPGGTLAGQTYTIMRQRVYIAPLGTPLPGMDIAYGGAWPSGWVRVPNTDEGAQITISNSLADITSDENGLLGVVQDDSAEVTIAFTVTTPSMDLVQYIARFDKEAVAAASPYPAFERYSLAKEPPAFMVGIEGKFDADSLYDTAGFVRAFGYKVIQSEDTELSFRTRGGEDAVFKPAASLRCLQTTLDPAQLQNTGITTTSGKFDLFVVTSTS